MQTFAIISIRSLTKRIMITFSTTAIPISFASPGKSPVEICLSIAFSMIRGFTRLTNTQNAMIARTARISFL